MTIEETAASRAHVHGVFYACPCVKASEPCHPNCTCAKPWMSHGCYCCAKYGSAEQQKAAADFIVASMRLAVRKAEEQE
jgi:hypothetical protein